MHECAYSINEPLVIGSVLKEDFEDKKKNLYWKESVNIS